MRLDEMRKSIKKVSSLGAVQKHLGISHQTMTNKMSGVTDFTVTELLEIARFLDWTVEEFVHYTGWEWED